LEELQQNDENKSYQTIQSLQNVFENPAMWVIK